MFCVVYDCLVQISMFCIVYKVCCFVGLDSDHCDLLEQNPFLTDDTTNMRPG
jgi:hypothetical protein